jgi:hypothetical protein
VSLKANVSNVALVSVKRRKPTVGFELAGDTDLTSKYCIFIDWQQSHQSGHSPKLNMCKVDASNRLLIR